MPATPSSTDTASNEAAALDALDHVAIETADVARAVEWYSRMFRCKVAYQDQTWALIELANVKLAFVTPGQHDAHLGFVHPNAEAHGPLGTHRDGIRYVYIKDPDNNTVELLAEPE